MNPASSSVQEAPMTISETDESSPCLPLTPTYQSPTYEPYATPSSVYDGFIAPAAFPVYPSQPAVYRSQSPMRSGVGHKRVASPSAYPQLADARAARNPQADDARAARLGRPARMDGGYAQPDDARAARLGRGGSPARSPQADDARAARFGSPGGSPQADDRPARMEDVGFSGRRYSQLDDARAARFYRVHQWGGGGDILIDPGFPGEGGSAQWQRAVGMEVRRVEHQHPDRLFTGVNGAFMLGQIVGGGLQHHRGGTDVMDTVDMHGFLPGEGGPVSPTYSPVPVRARSWSPVPDAEQGRRASSVELSVRRLRQGYTPVEPSQSPVHPTYNSFLLGPTRLQARQTGQVARGFSLSSSLSDGWVQGSTHEEPEGESSMPATEVYDSWDEEEDSPSVTAHDGDYGFTYASSPSPPVPCPANDVVRAGVEDIIRGTGFGDTGMTFRGLRRQLELNLGLPEGRLDTRRALIRLWIDEIYADNEPSPSPEFSLSRSPVF